MEAQERVAPALNGRGPTSGETRALKKAQVKERYLNTAPARAFQARSIHNDDGHFLGLEVVRV